MNNRIIGKKIAVSVKFEVVAGFIEQHLLGVFQVLPHRQFSGMRVFTNQRLKNLIVIVTPVVDGTGIDMVVQFFPVRVVNALSLHFLNDCRQRRILRGQRHLDVELKIPF